MRIGVVNAEDWGTKQKRILFFIGGQCEDGTGKAAILLHGGRGREEPRRRRRKGIMPASHDTYERG